MRFTSHWGEVYFHVKPFQAETTAEHNLASFGIMCMKTGFVTLVFACFANWTLLTPPSSHVNHLIHDRISFRSFCDHKAHPRERKRAWIVEVLPWSCTKHITRSYVTPSARYHRDSLSMVVTEYPPFYHPHHCNNFFLVIPNIFLNKRHIFPDLTSVTEI